MKRIYEYSVQNYSETRVLLNYYNNIEMGQLDDNEIFQELSWIVYSSGFKNDILKKYWPKIKNAYYDFSVKQIINNYHDVNSAINIICKKSEFNNKNKAKWCIYNAFRIEELNKNYRCIGGLKGYLTNLANKDEIELIKSIPLIIKDLNFKGIGNITIFHLLKNIGINIYKPDVHVSRILSDVGIFNEYRSYYDVYNILKKISGDMNVEIYELDSALFVYGKNNPKIFQI